MLPQHEITEAAEAIDQIQEPRGDLTPHNGAPRGSSPQCPMVQALTEYLSEVLARGREARSSLQLTQMIKEQGADLERQIRELRAKANSEVPQAHPGGRWT